MGKCPIKSMPTLMLVNTIIVLCKGAMNTLDGDLKEVQCSQMHDANLAFSIVAQPRLSSCPDQDGLTTRAGLLKFGKLTLKEALKVQVIQT